MMIWSPCEEWSKRYLPEDVWTEILSRLPVKSLLRFRSVSKSWLALIDDPEFARFHLNNFRNNRDETHFLVFPDCKVRSSESFETDSGSIWTSMEKKLAEDNCQDSQEEKLMEIACCVDGLLLLTRTCDSYRRYPDLVWNPSIRKFRELPSLPNDASPNNDFGYDANGLGYDKLAKDYKIVRLLFAKGLESRTLHSVAILTLGGNSWKIMKFPDVAGFNWHLRSDRSYPHGLYFQGCLYFVATATDLVSFDLSREEFSFISLPDVGCIDRFRELAVVDGGCTMAAFYSSLRECSVWVLDTESMNWTKRYTCQDCELNWCRVLYLKSNGEILAQRHRLEQVVSYSPKTDEYKIVHEHRASIVPIITHVFGYIQSLILHI